MRERIILGVLCAMMSVSMMAQSVREGEMAVVYYMPQTQLVIDVEYEAVILHRGIYAEYAKQYLGSTEVVNDDAIWYRITDIHPRIKTVADYSRMYKVGIEPKAVVNYQMLSLTREGTLLGYNIERENTRKDKPCCHHPKNDANGAREENNANNVLPLFEEHIVGKSLAEQAQGAAKLIYRIRENRLYLIGGEVDKVPADGKAMELALDKMDALEKQLVELFIGHIEVEKRHKSFTYTPMKSEEVELAYFSEQNGFTTFGNGDPIMLNITARRQTKGNPNSDGKKVSMPSPLFYNLPGSMTYTVTYLNEVRAEGEAQVAQFGVDVPLAQDLFTGKQPIHIRFNPQTGNIEAIEN